MRLFSTEARVGVVVLAALASLTWLTFQIGEFRFKEKGYVLEAAFRTVSGLETEAKVRMAGVLVGSVDRIYLKEGRAHVLLRLDDGVEVREDSTVSVASIGILSERYVEITTGSRAAKVLPPGAVVEGRELVDLDQMMAEMARSSEAFRSLAATIEQTFAEREASVAELLRQSTGLVERISALLDDNRRRLDELIAQAAGVARDTRALVKDAHALVSDNREELHEAITGLHALAGTLNRRADELGEEAKRTAVEARAEVAKTAEELRAAVRGGREDLQGLLTSLRAAAGSAEAAAQTLTKILEKVEGGQGTLGRLVNDETTIDRVDAALGDLGGIAQKINSGEGSLGRLVTDDTLVTKLEDTADSASRLLGAGDRMRFYLGYRGEYLERVTALKSYVTVKLQPRADKYYLLELIDDPGGKTTTKTTRTTITRSDGSSYTTTEETEETEDDELLFSLQFAKSVGPLTFRGGLVESQGGVGLDYRTLGDRLRLSLEGWHFGREGGPHLKASGQLALYKDFYLTAGVDDWYDEDRRSVFLGGGILFSDEDLREMLSLTRFAP